ncbi:Islet cell autoantigen 1 [Cichlidogyrus casuarinus]|uniref:Islet cell autoantigen 1 n=1 Tax=Cichlidogyrus casuarinus TaxID=1844966 RepID=A0ABD2QC44_9PLAT
MGRFLKQCSQSDYTKAGEMMAQTGKTLSYSAQQRIALRVPLERLAQEVDTFRLRAICDSTKTLRKMENRRTEYRGALMWMKNASEELEPDSYKQMEKFRKVQAQVKKTKEVFDKLKIDSMQKIDLLAASRSNMLSHVLVGYQKALLEFWQKTEKSMTAIAESFQGYQYYEFSTLKELNVENQKLALSQERTESAEDALAQNDENLLDFGDDHPVSVPQLFDLTAPSENLSSEDLVTNQEVSKDDKEFLLDIFGESAEATADTGGFDSWLGSTSTQEATVMGPFSAAWNSISQSTFQPETTEDQESSTQKKADLSQNESKNGQSNTTSAWMDLFSDLGPMGNPDSIGKKAEEIENL